MRWFWASLLVACPLTTLVRQIPAQEPRGLLQRTGQARGGFTLFTPLHGSITYLVDMAGQAVHVWRADAFPGASEYLLENGHLLRCVQAPEDHGFLAGGRGGRLLELDWEGQVVWDYTHASDREMQHHDVEPLPGGNVLILCWERRRREEALAAGADPERVEGEVWSEAILEIEPRRPSGGRVVWEWRAFDHLVQDLDPALPRYAAPGERPHRIDVNAGRPRAAEGIVAGRGGPAADWLHANSIAYHPEQDLILLSIMNLSELWVLDHGTTTAQARGSTGGRAGRGGDLLARWGNPAVSGASGSRFLFGQHDAQWIPEGLEGAGDVLVFNNGVGPGEARAPRSAVLQIPWRVEGEDPGPVSHGFGPAPVWTYEDGPRFQSHFLSSAQRLDGGHTLICSGAQGRIFEVDRSGVVCWEFLNPFLPDAGRPRSAPGLGRGRAPADRPPESAAAVSGSAPGVPFATFRARRIAGDHPALQGRALRPLDPQPARVDRP